MKFHAYGINNFDQILQLQQLTANDRFAIRVVASVLPFRVNNYVIEQLIDWTNIPNDPIFHISFPQPAMLASHNFQTIATPLKNNAPADIIRTAAVRIYRELTTSSRAADTQCSSPRWPSPRWRAAQVPGDRPLLSQPRTELFHLLHLLFSLAPVCGGKGITNSRLNCRPPLSLPAITACGHRSAHHRRRSPGDEGQPAGTIHHTVTQ